jgi:hypothetical protein
MGSRIITALLLIVVAAPLDAQDRLPWFVGAGLGPVRQDRQGNDLLYQNGNFYQVHGGWQWNRHLSARLDLARASIAQNDDDIVTAPCPDPPVSCPVPFLGPVRLTGMSIGLEASWADRRILLMGSVAPGGYWLTERPPGTRAFAGGVRIGIGGGYQLAKHLWAVLDLHYYRLFTDGRSPRWLVPGSIGVEVR